jgi:hypothetical protein
MLSRVLTLFLALALLWSGFSSAEPQHVPAQPAYAQMPAMVDAPGQAVGHEDWVEQHQPDDLTPQAQTETQTESPGLLLAVLVPSVPALVMAQPRAFASAEAGPPFLAGPLRPPRSAARAG